MIKFILVLLSVHALKNVQAGNIDDTVTIGEKANIDPSVVIKANTQIGYSVKIGGLTRIGESCQVGAYCDIRSNVTIGNRVTLNNQVFVFNGVEINDDTLVDKYSDINVNVTIASKVYVGVAVLVQANATVNENAILHEDTKIPVGYTVKKNEVVICSPSPVKLHEKSASIKSLSNDQVRIANDNSTVPSKAFNDMLRSLLNDQINDVKAKCEQGNTTTPDLSIINALFLIQRHGKERFNETYEKVHEERKTWDGDADGNEIINGFRIPAAFHLGESEDNDILKPDVKKKFIQLLEIEEDSKRVNRLTNDTFCSTTAQILNGDRTVTVTKARSRNFANNISINFILISATLLINVYSLFFVLC